MMNKNAFPKLIASKDRSIEPQGEIGLQTCGLIFWQKTGFLRHCNALGFEAITKLVVKKFKPTRVQYSKDRSYFLTFHGDENKIMFLTLKREPHSLHQCLYGESHTAYTDAEFHIFILQVIQYIAEQLGCNFYVDDATDYLTDFNYEKLKSHIVGYDPKGI